MHDWGRDLATLQRHLDERVPAAVRRQQQAEQRFAGTDMAIFDESLDRTAAPGDAPAQYREVVDKFDVGELDWQTVMSGDAEDEGGRAMSVWMDRRLQQIAEVGKMIRRGVPAEDAYAEVTASRTWVDAKVRLSMWRSCVPVGDRNSRTQRATVSPVAAAASA